MNKKKLACIVIVLALLISAIYLISPLNRSYSIENTTMNITVSPFGTIYMIEEHDYSFNGEFNGIYRDLPLKYGEYFGYFHASVEGAYPVIEQNEDSSGKHLKIYLYSDKDHTQKIKNCDVHVTYRYSIENVVTLYKDVGVLQYKLWDKYWDVGTGNINAVVNLPGNDSNTYFVNPDGFTNSSGIDGNVINIKSNAIPKGEIYELLVLMPADDFYKSSFSNYYQDTDAKNRIIQELNESLKRIDDENSYNSFMNKIFMALAAIGPIVLTITYFRYGREPEVDYYGTYERELPTDDPPEVVNAIFGQSFVIGLPTIEGFEASILNLIDRKIIGLKTQEDSESGTKELLLSFSNDKNDELTSSESIIYDTLSAFATDNVLSLSKLKTKLKSQSDAKWFMKRINEWKKNVENENKEKTKRYFNETGSTIGKALGIIGTIAGLIMFFIIAFLFPLNDLRIHGIIFSIIIFITGLVSFFLPDDYLGNWTPEGKLLHLKWENFKKFLNDYSLIEEHPPESIVIWKKYLIYGAALGLADKVYESMKLQVPDIEEYDDGILLYHSYDGFSAMHSAIKTGEYSANPSDSSGGGSSGGFGGGSGGGGGGAF